MSILYSLSIAGYLQQSCSVYAPAERVDKLPRFILYPFLLCVRTYRAGRAGVPFRFPVRILPSAVPGLTEVGVLVRKLSQLGPLS
jgi:hypothetical protein